MSVNLSQQDYELLSAYIDGELSDAERLGLEIRLDAEANLRRELDAMRQTVTLVNRLPRLKAPRNFTLTVTPQKVVRKLPLFLTSTFSGLSAAAAVLLLMFGGYLLLGSNSQLTMTSQFAREVAVQSTAIADVVTLPAQSTLLAPALTQTPAATLIPQGGMLNTAPAMPEEEIEQATQDEAAMLDTFSMEMATEEPGDSAGASVMQEADDEQITLEALLYATDADVIAAAPMAVPTQAAADITAQRNVIEPTATALATATIADETTKLPENRGRVATLDSGTVGLVIVAVGAVLLLIALATTIARRNARI